MALSQALLQVLNNDEEPLKKRLKIANNAFNTSEFLVQHKEALLLKWVVSVSSKEGCSENNGAPWDLIQGWLSSKEFVDLTQNDITNEDIFTIIQIFRSTLLDENTSTNHRQQIISCVLLLCSSKVFQQYFKYNLELYCQLIAGCLKNLNDVSKFIECVNKPFLFSKHLVELDGFPQCFLNVLYNVFVSKILEFQDNSQVFNEAVQIVQRCLLQGHIKDFQSFLDRLFDPENGEKAHSALPKSIFKYLRSTLPQNDSGATMSFKLFFAAFCSSSKDPQLSFKCLILLVQLLQFDLSTDFAFKAPFKQKSTIPLSKSLNVFLGILEVLSVRTFTDCTVANISLSKFLRKMLDSLIALNRLNSIIFQIIKKCILINPLVIEPLVSSLVVFIMLRNHQDSEELYEEVVIAIFEVYAKLHRVENLVSKLIPALKSASIAQNAPEETDMQIYDFKGEQDIEICPQEMLPVRDVFSINILDYFTKCLLELASWQVINVFKSMLHHLRNTIDEFSRGDFDDQDSNGFAFLELLGTLTTCLLQGIRIADHAIPQNVVTKFVNGLEEMKIILGNFGSAILKREHNQTTMRTFLSLAYAWAEIYITLTYYSINNEVRIPTKADSAPSAANLTYLHSYMDVKEWQLIEQRISNFGKHPCKRLLHKLYIQKAKSMVLLEKKLNNEILTNVALVIPAHLDDTWEELLMDKFAVNSMLDRMDTASLTFLADRLIENEKLFEEKHIKDSITLINVMAYVTMSKINKLFTMKRKRDVEESQSCSSVLYSLFPKDLFFSNKCGIDVNDFIEKLKHVYTTLEDETARRFIRKEAELLSNFKILQKLPFIYSEASVQKCILLYLMALNKDIPDCSDKVKAGLESLIIGIIQAYKFPLAEIFSMETLAAQVLNNFSNYAMLFPLIIDNAFKDEISILSAEALISFLVKRLDNSKHLNASLIVLRAVSKVKKSKMSASSKEQANKYKEKILKKLSKLICKSDYLVEAYAVCLKHYLSVEKESETLQTLLDKLDSYIDYSLANISEENKNGCTLLFTLVLQNRTQIKTVKSDIVLRTWNSCKLINTGQNFTHLFTLIVSQIPNEEFEVLLQDLLQLTQKSIKSRSHLQLAHQLKTWESMLSCDVNAIKMSIWQRALENLISELLPLLKRSICNDVLLKSIIDLKQRVLQTQHFIMSAPLIDMLMMTPSILMKDSEKQFESAFSSSISILEMFLKNRNAIVMDRLPVYLQQYRVLLKAITSKSNSDESNMEKIDVKTASDCVHRLEKLTKHLVACKRDMKRIAAFLIADILETYERINLYPNVKLHLNNCVYSLISLCDIHAISYLMRVLSNASTEMFKIMYEHYKKYYRFTGKV